MILGGLVGFTVALGCTVPLACVLRGMFFLGPPPPASLLLMITSTVGIDPIVPRYAIHLCWWAVGIMFVFGLICVGFMTGCMGEFLHFLSDEMAALRVFTAEKVSEAGSSIGEAVNEVKTKIAAEMPASKAQTMADEAMKVAKEKADAIADERTRKIAEQKQRLQEAEMKSKGKANRRSQGSMADHQDGDAVGGMNWLEDLVEFSSDLTSGHSNPETKIADPKQAFKIVKGVFVKPSEEAPGGDTATGKKKKKDKGKDKAKDTTKDKTKVADESAKSSQSMKGVNGLWGGLAGSKDSLKELEKSLPAETKLAAAPPPLPPVEVVPSKAGGRQKKKERDRQKKAEREEAWRKFEEMPEGPKKVAELTRLAKIDADDAAAREVAAPKAPETVVKPAGLPATSPLNSLPLHRPAGKQSINVSIPMSELGGANQAYKENPSWDNLDPEAQTKLNAQMADILKQEMRMICAFCKRRSLEPLKHCSACSTVSYCSRDCQLADWKNHKVECKKQQKLKKQESS